jgi:hypothetical protein
VCREQSIRCSFEEVLGLMLQNVPPDDQKIKTLVSSSLYAYELPESVSSGSASGGEEERLSLCSLRSQREAQTFTAIQRSVQPKQQSAGDLSCVYDSLRQLICKAVTLRLLGILVLGL